MKISSEKIKTDDTNSLADGLQTYKNHASQNSSTLINDNHVLHFNHLPPYMIQDILDILKQCNINDWTIDNKDDDTVLSFHPEADSKVEVFYTFLTGYQIKYNRMAV